jgi:UDP-3-O-[3-hydroxymyristoyl] glucosamine N-acyltransferase
MIGGRDVSVGNGVRVIVRVAVGRSVQVGRGVRVMVGVTVKVAVTAEVRVMVTVGGRRVEVGREREAGGYRMRRAMKIKNNTTSMIKKAGSKGRAEGVARFMAKQIIPEKRKIGT